MRIHSSAVWRRFTLVLLFIGLSVSATPAPGVSANSPTTVSVSSVDGPTASEAGPSPGLFTFTRSNTNGDYSTSLTVSFALAGTATKGTDYSMWESVATFEPGATKAYVAVLPKNDTLQEGDETIILTVSSGTGYTAGISNNATVTIKDVYYPNAPGVWDNSIPTDPTTGYALVTPAIGYLDAAVSANQLGVYACIENPMLPANMLEFFLDTDQNTATGDWRQGHVAGMDYRVEADINTVATIPGMPPLSTGTVNLWKLPTAPPTDSTPVEDDTLVSAPISIAISGNCVTIQAPLSSIATSTGSTPTAVDLFATTSIGTNGVTGPGEGDRIPEYGVYDTSSRQVVVRNPGTTHYITLTNPVQGPIGGFPLTSASYISIADQFAISLHYAQSFDPSNGQLSVGPQGIVEVDGDRSITTGQLPMGGQIPTWGGDIQLSYTINSYNTSGVSFLLQFEKSGAGTLFGFDRNDGRWLVPQGNTLIIQGSLSLFDAFQEKFLPSGAPKIHRIPTDGRIYAQTWTEVPQRVGSQSYSLPGPSSVADTSNGQVLQPLAWDSTTQTVQDPDNEVSSTLSGQDITQIDTQVTQNNLIIRVWLSSWLNTDIGNIFNIWLDADMSSRTYTVWPPLQKTQGTITNPGGPIGPDYDIHVESFEGSSGAPDYSSHIFYPDGSYVPSFDLLYTQTPATALQPGSFTVTIPLSTLQNPSQLRLYASAGTTVADMVDISPQAPVVVTTGNGPAVIVSPTSLTFGSQPVGTTGSSQSVTVKNTGNVAASLSSIGIAGTNASDFAETSSCPISPNTLAAGANCTITVTFTPSASGTRTATLSINDNAAGSPQTVSLSGTGTSPAAPAVTLSPTGLSFPSQTIGTSSSQTTTLSNTGTASLSLSSISIAGSNASDFSQTNTCGTSVSAGANCTITVTFTPSASGTRTATLSINDNAAGSPQTVSLSGTGTSPSGGATVTIQAGAGWNMVGGSPLTLWPDSQVNWSWNAATGQWTHPTGSEPAGTGTWEYLNPATTTPHPETVSVQQCSSPMSVSVVAYRWNMVGNPCSTSVTVPSSARAYWYDPSSNRYVLVTSINPGAAAWVKPSSSSLTLTPSSSAVLGTGRALTVVRKRTTWGHYLTSAARPPPLPARLGGNWWVTRLPKGSTHSMPSHRSSPLRTQPE